MPNSLKAIGTAIDTTSGSHRRRCRSVVIARVRSLVDGNVAPTVIAGGAKQSPKLGDCGGAGIPGSRAGAGLPAIPNRQARRNCLRIRDPSTIVLLWVARRLLPPGAEGARGSEPGTQKTTKCHAERFCEVCPPVALRPGRITSGPPTVSPYHDWRREGNSETVSESLSHQ